MPIFRKSVSLVMGLLAASALTAQESKRTAVCTFGDGKEFSIRYSPAAEKELPEGKVWTPGGEPIYLFSQAELVVGNKTLEPKAYRIFLIPGKRQWTLVINEDVEKDSKYDQGADVARVQMDTGKLSRPEAQFRLALGRIAPKRCSLRAYHGKVGAFTAISEK